MIQLDIESMVADLQLTKDEFDQVRQLVVKAYVDEVYTETVELAIDKLASARGEYVGALKIIKVDNYTYDLELSGSKLALMIENGCGSFDMKCIVRGDTKIYTSNGNKCIRDIKKGDLVLTHNGKMKKVSSIFKEKNEDEFVYRLTTKVRDPYNSIRSIVVTGNHPFLTNKGWVKARELDVNKHKLIISANRCSHCHKLLPVDLGEIDKHDGKVYCNKSCAAKVNNEFRRLSGRPDMDEKARANISALTIARNKKLYREGKHTSQPGGKLYAKFISGEFRELLLNHPNWKGFDTLSPEKMSEVQHKAAIGWGNASSNGSVPEMLLWDLLKRTKYNIKQQFAFKRDVVYWHKKWGKNVNRYYYLDFAIPEYKICIEVNGERWHTEEQILLKKAEIEAMGWIYIDLKPKDIYKDISSCFKQIMRILKNHNNEYEFIENDFEIEKINIQCKSFKQSWNHSYNYKYNLTVEDDSSYVANSFVTHNSGFSRSPKAIKTSKGWYLTIPMLFKTPSANPRSDTPGQLLPRRIYDLIRNSPSTVKDTGDEEISTLSGADVPKKYQPGQLTSLNNTADTYIHKNSIYAGLTRTKDKATGFSNYNTFRRVSNNSDPKSWIHPGIPAYNLMDRAVENVDQLDIAETALQKFFPTSTLRVSIHNQLAMELNTAYNKMLTDMLDAIVEQIKDAL